MSSSHIEQLAALIRSSASSGRTEFKTALLRVSAEIKDRIRQSSPTSNQFFLDALTVLTRIKGKAYARLRMECLFDSGHYFFVNGKAIQALHAAGQLNDLARACRDKHWERKAHMLCGIAYGDMGSVAEAVISYSKALTLTHELKDISGEISVLNNLGTALNYGGLYREAIPCLSRIVTLVKTDWVIEACDAAGTPANYLECAALNNLAQSHLYLEQFEEGYAAIHECLAKSPPPTDGWSAGNMAIRELTCVRLALGKGDLEAARLHSKSCQTYAAVSGTKARHQAQIAEALCEVHGGRVNHGIHILQSALSDAAEWDSIRMDILEALAVACHQAGRSEEAFQYIRQMLSCIAERRQKGILALLSLPTYKGDQRVLAATDDLRALKLREAQLRAKIAENEAINSRAEILERLAVAADLKEEASGEHGYRVGKLSSLLAEYLELPRDQLFAIELAARLHDVGKIGVPDRILLNSQELRESERHFISTHTIIGAELLAKSDIPQLRMAEQIARSHHEWWNGEGYPSKLKGSRIPLHARIVALADVFDALTHGRPYATAWSVDEALAEIRNRRGTQFDPDLTDRFIELVERLRKEHTDLDAYLGKASRDSPFLQARNKIRLMLASEREHERAAAVTGNETRH